MPHSHMKAKIMSINLEILTNDINNIIFIAIYKLKYQLLITQDSLLFRK